MGNRDKKKRRCSSLLWFPTTKRRKNKIRASSTSKRTNVRFRGALKDMRKLSSNDEAFHLSSEEICGITDIILSRVTPTRRTYRKWDQYAISFYLKMCTCFRVDYKNLEATTSDDQSDDDQSDDDQSDDDQSDDDENEDKPASPLTKELECLKQYSGRRRFLKGPFELGCYSPGTKPDCIPYHLYLLVKEAVDIMNRDMNNTDDLNLVEQKISFFCTFFHSHLPTGWNYKRDNASSLIAGYDTKQGGRRYNRGGYTPFRGWGKPNEYIPTFDLYADEVVETMSTIHSRKTPTFWKMNGMEISFYCKLCSCFGIDYHCLEAASEDDVCLMYTGRKVAKLGAAWYGLSAKHVPEAYQIDRTLSIIAMRYNLQKRLEYLLLGGTHGRVYGEQSLLHFFLYLTAT